MNKRDLKTNVTVIILLLLSFAVRAQVAEPKGELTSARSGLAGERLFW